MRVSPLEIYASLIFSTEVLQVIFNPTTEAGYPSIWVIDWHFAVALLISSATSVSNLNVSCACYNGFDFICPGTWTRRDSNFGITISIVT